jgi:hypothetical protein
VDALFLLNYASWDLLGIHWRSYSGQGSYYETGVVRTVKLHNAKVNYGGKEVPAVGNNMGRLLLQQEAATGAAGVFKKRGAL